MFTVKSFHKIIDCVIKIITQVPHMVHFYIYFKDYLILERKEGREREGDKHQCVVTSRAPLY